MASEYEENYFNFCECVFVNALGKEMVSSGKDSLFIDEEELHRFSAEYIGKTAEEINEILEKSAVSILGKLDLMKIISRIFQMSSAPLHCGFAR